MKASPFWTLAVGSLLCAACGGNTIDTTSTSGTSSGTSSGASTTTTGGSTTTTGAASTTGSGTSTTGTTGTTTSASATAGGSTTGTTTGSNCITVPNYPGNACTWSTTIGSVFNDVSLEGGAAENFSTTASKDLTTNLASSMDFSTLHALAAQGFRYVFVDVSAVWCPNCQAEAQVLPNQYTQKWLNKGGLIFSVLVQTGSSSAPATQADLATWINQYGINYPMSLDTQENMTSALGLTGWPSNVFIRLSDMVVVGNPTGQGQANYDAFDAQLDYCETSMDCWSGATCNNYTCM